MAGRKLSDAITSPKSTMLTESFFLFDVSKIFSNFGAGTGHISYSA